MAAGVGVGEFGRGDGGASTLDYKVGLKMQILRKIDFTCSMDFKLLN
jgi:hypothetical protein